MIQVVDLAALAEAVGRELAVSDWVELTQTRIDRFAEATDDRQWIHVDARRAAEQLPGGSTIAHGFLTLSLLPRLLHSAVDVPGVRRTINYGLNRVRFVSPVPSNGRIRARFTPRAVLQRDDGADVTWDVVVELEGGDRPCCVAEWIARYLT
jgi:acyl dehydratase